MVFAGRISEWNYWTKSKQLMQCSNVSDSAIPCQVSLSMEFFRQEYWNKLPLPPLGDLPDPGIEPTSLSAPALAGRFFTTTPPGKHQQLMDIYQFHTSGSHEGLPEEESYTPRNADLHFQGKVEFT